MATGLIPASLRRLTGGQSRMTVEAASVGDVLDRLDTLYPGVRGHLFALAGR